MIRRTLLTATVAASLAVAATADAAQFNLAFTGGALLYKTPDQIQVWANSPAASLAVDNRRAGTFTTLAVTWQNLMAGTYLTTPEGVAIASTRDGSDMASQLTLPPGERQSWSLNPNINGPYRFAVIADTASDDAHVFGALSHRMEGQRVNFAVHLGNAVAGGNASQMALFRNQLKSFRFPTYVVPGNQDLTHGGREDWQKLFGKMPLSFRVDGDRFILLDNAFGTLAPGERAWLESALAQAQTEQARHVFVFLHQPLVDPRPGINRAMRDIHEVRDLLSLFQRAGVDTVFAGHIRMYARETRKGVDYVTTGGGGAPLVVPPARGGYHHYMLVSVDGPQVEIEPVAL